MQGHFDVGLFDAHGMSDADFLALNAELKSSAFLDRIKSKHKRVQHVEGNNLVSDGMAQYLFIQCFPNVPAVDAYFNDSTGSGRCALDFVNLSTKDGDPSYLERDTHGYYSVDMQNVSYSANTSTGSKWFNADTIITAATFADPDGREGFYLRNQWLWLPSQGTSNAIRSITIWFNTGGDGSNYISGKNSICRIRLKDAGGVGVTINKTTSQVLLVEYIFKFITV